MKYLAVYEKIKNGIINGTYGYGEKLPSKRDEAVRENVSFITVQHAYELLCDEGYVEAAERSGYYVIYREKDFIEKHKPDACNVTTEEAVPHVKGEFSYNVLAKTMRKVMADSGDRILEKAPNKGCIELRRAIASHLSATRGMDIGIDQIVVGAGAEYLYGLIAQLFSHEKVIAVEQPCYSKIEKVYEAWGHKVDRLRMGYDGIFTEDLINTKASILHVTPFHSYPSNVTAGISKKREYLRWASEGRYIIEDNYDSELTVSRKLEDALFSISRDENVIYMNTFTKTIAPSVRVGYMILPKKLLDMYEKKLGFYSCSVPVFEQLVLAELMDSGEYTKQVNRMRRKRRSGC